MRGKLILTSQLEKRKHVCLEKARCSTNLSIFANILKYKVQNALDLVLTEHIAYLQWFIQIFNLNYLRIICTENMNLHLK